MENLMVLAMILLFSFQSGFCGLYGRFYPGDKSRASLIYSVFYGLIVGIVTLTAAGFRFSPSPLTWVLGIANGLVLFSYNALLLAASSRGSYSIVMIMNLSGGILLPLLFSVIVDREHLSFLQTAAIAVMILSFVLINMEPKSEKSGADSANRNPKNRRLFLLLCTLLGLANGIYGILMNSSQRAMANSENAEMILVTFGVSSISALAMLLITSRGHCIGDFRQTPRSAFSMIAASVSAAAAVNIMMYGLSLINVAVMYTLNNGGVLLVSVLWSVVFFKEKLGRVKVAGLILAAAAMVILSIA